MLTKLDDADTNEFRGLSQNNTFKHETSLQLSFISCMTFMCIISISKGHPSAGNGLHNLALIITMIW